MRTTARIEHILARELGKEALAARGRETISSAAGRQLVKERQVGEGTVESLLFLDSGLFRVPSAGRHLLQECGLLPG